MPATRPRARVDARPWSRPSAALREIAAEVARLLPCWRDPERYFEARSDLAERLLALADKAETHEEMTRYEGAAMAVYGRICEYVPRTVRGALTLIVRASEDGDIDNPEMFASALAGLREIAAREAMESTTAAP